jgi:hypothetical protein
MKFVFIAKYRTIWPVARLCDALGCPASSHRASCCGLRRLSADIIT